MIVYPSHQLQPQFYQILDLPCALKMCHQLKRVWLPPPNIHGTNTGHLSSTASHYRWFFTKVFCSRSLDSHVCFQLPEVHKRSMISLDLAEIFEPILASILRNNCTNSCFPSLLSTVSVCVPATSTTRHNLTKNKSIALLTRQLAGNIIAFNFFYVRPD